MRFLLTFLLLALATGSVCSYCQYTRPEDWKSAFDGAMNIGCGHLTKMAIPDLPVTPVLQALLGAVNIIGGLTTIITGFGFNSINVLSSDITSCEQGLTYTVKLGSDLLCSVWKPVPVVIETTCIVRPVLENGNIIYKVLEGSRRVSFSSAGGLAATLQKLVDTVLTQLLPLVDKTMGYVVDTCTGVLTLKWRSPGFSYVDGMQGQITSVITTTVGLVTVITPLFDGVKIVEILNPDDAIASMGDDVLSICSFSYEHTANYLWAAIARANIKKKILIPSSALRNVGAKWIDNYNKDIHLEIAFTGINNVISDGNGGLYANTRCQATITTVDGTKIAVVNFKIKLGATVSISRSCLTISIYVLSTFEVSSIEVDTDDHCNCKGDIFGDLLSFIKDIFGPYCEQINCQIYTGVEVRLPSGGPFTDGRCETTEKCINCVAHAQK